MAPVGKVVEQAMEIARLRMELAALHETCDQFDDTATRLRAELAAEQENSRGWRNDFDHEVEDHAECEADLNHAMSFEHMIKLFEVMVEVGIMEKGFLEATKQRGFSAVRPPRTAKA